MVGSKQKIFMKRKERRESSVVVRSETVCEVDCLKKDGEEWRRYEAR